MDDELANKIAAIDKLGAWIERLRASHAELLAAAKAAAGVMDKNISAFDFVAVKHLLEAAIAKAEELAS